MRASTGGEQAVLQAPFRKTYYRVTMADATGTPQDLTNFVGYDWVSDVTIDENIDQPVAGCTIALWRQLDIVGGLGIITLSPLRSDSSANVSGPAISVNRSVQVYMAVVVGARPINASTDWKLKFDGYTDQVEFASETVKVTCRDLGGELVDQVVNPGTLAQPNFIDRPDLPQTLESLIDHILTFALVGGVSPTVYVPTDPAYLVASFPAVSETVMSAAQRAAGLAALDFRYAWDGNTSTYRPTLIIPTRVAPASSWTYPRGSVVKFTQLGFDRLAVRNQIRINYRPQDAAAGRRTFTVANDAASQALYGLRPLVITEADDSDINTLAKASNMAALILADLKDPKATAEVEILPDWRVELFDYDTFAANRYFDTDQSWAIVAVRHELTPNKQRTILTVRGTPSAAYERWLARARTLGPEYVLTDADNGLSEIQYTEDPVFFKRTWTWTRGANVAFVAFYENVAATPIGAASYPVASSIINIGSILPTATNSYTAQIPPRGKQRFGIAVPYYKSGGTYVQGEAVKFTLDAIPSATAASIKGTVTNGTVDLSADIAGGFSDFPLAVDFYADDIAGAPIASTSIVANSTLDKTSPGLGALGALALPLRELRRFWVRVTNVANEVVWAEVGLDRTSLPYAQLTVRENLLNPVLQVDFDASVTKVKFFLPGGKSKTFNAPFGGTNVTYTVGDGGLDAAAAPEAALAFSEIRTGYGIEVTGGGVIGALWGAGATANASLKGPIAGGIPQGSIEVSSNGAPTWTEDGPAAQDHIKYAESTSGYPSDATARAGTTLSGRVVTRTGGAALTFGQSLFVTIVSYDAAGNEIQIIHLKGSYQTFSGSKTTAYGVSQWIINPFFTPGTFSLQNGILQCAAMPNNIDVDDFNMTPVVPDGVNITNVSLDVVDNCGGTSPPNNTHPISFDFWRAPHTILGNQQSTRGAGAQTLSIALSEPTAGRTYIAELDFEGGVCNAGDCQARTLFITYTQATPQTTV